MKARDVMTTKVRTVKLTTPIRKISRLLVSRRISAVPVVDKNQHVLGIVSEGDLLRRTEAGTERRRSWWADLMSEPVTRAREFVKSHGGKARDVMSRSVVCATADTELADIATLMDKWDVKRVPIVKGGKLIGIVSRSDVVWAVSRAKPQARSKSTDAELRQRLMTSFRSKAWAARSIVNFVVEKGRVELFGLVGSEAQRDAVRVLAEGTAGVRSVANRMSLMSRVS